MEQDSQGDEKTAQRNYPNNIRAAKVFEDPRADSRLLQE